MKKIYCVICDKALRHKALVPYIICSKYENNDEKMSKEEENS